MAALATLRANRPGLVDRPLAIDADVAALLAAHAPVAIGVSGGKDSCALALVVVEHLRAIGHRGSVVLVHADLGRVEWRDSLPTCQRLAAHLGVGLLVVRREKGDMMDRWLQRWRDNVRRYVELECVKLILPWSTPSMRFCTSELKTSVIHQALVRRFPRQTIVSVSGIRHDESRDRASAPISAPAPGLERTKLATRGFDWHPLVEWTENDVKAYCASRGFALHEGYTRFGMSRISCAFCIMADAADLAASSACSDNQDIYREMVALELRSTFAFQGNRWLADVAPDLLSFHADYVVARKAAAEARVVAEERIPHHLLFTRGWPTVMPTRAEAELLCEVRRAVAASVGIEIKYTEPDALLARYAELVAEKATREAAKARKARRGVTS